MTGKHGVHRTRMIGWHPRSLVLLAWIEAEIAKRGGGRGAQADVLEEGMEAARLASEQGNGCDKVDTEGEN